jgi:hypothetical protein
MGQGNKAALPTSLGIIRELPAVRNFEKYPVNPKSAPAVRRFSSRGSDNPAMRVSRNRISGGKPLLLQEAA